MTNPDLHALMEDPLSHLAATDPRIRRLAVSACAGRAGEPEVRAALVGLLSDSEATVRAEAVEVLAPAGASVLGAVLSLVDDPDPRVVEAATTALGEIGSPEAVPRLIELARSHSDRLVREAAVAALGAIGDVRALPALLELVRGGPPQVRRRAVVALTVFDHPEVEPALLEARSDRNPMVREVAEMIVGRAIPVWTGLELRTGDDA